MARRSYGTGSLIVRKDSTGRESWHAKVRIGQRQVWRKLGEKRASGTRDGLTAEGLDPDQLDRAFTRGLDALVVTPHGQNPFGASLSEERASTLRRAGVALLP